MGIVSDGERVGEISVESDREHESPHGLCKNLQEALALVMLRAENACGESDTFVETQDAVKKKLVKDKHPDVIPIFEKRPRVSVAVMKQKTRLHYPRRNA
jgi:hypothetical protein